ncbi:MAG TPA: metalloregulator ArsR/SmtB family transcription factor [Candidatus Limnocylindrales bacterium]|nr:metalloregulator ArsR/SmtB family transcription factor [Candidatus Limnocylindrales bacterium]
MPAVTVSLSASVPSSEPVTPPLRRDEAEHLARILKALADPTRLQILSIIHGSPNGEACVCDLTAPFDMTQPAISQHLKVLTDAGLLRRDKRGAWAWFSPVPESLELVRHLVPGPTFLQTASEPSRCQ